MTQSLDIALLPGERWWGGAAHDGVHMPFGDAPHSRDLWADSLENQAQSLLISNRGRWVWSEQPCAFAFDPPMLRIRVNSGTIQHGDGHADLRCVWQHAARTFFPASGTHPDALFFTTPQYNTWIEMLYEPTQDKVLRYAADALAHSMPPGVLMIDDNWQQDYGTWRFAAEQFPDPRGMADQLHALGFKLMLWLCPFVSPDSATFRMLEQRGFLLRSADGTTAVRRWWNGYSAVLDCTNDEVVAWLHDQLGALMRDYAIDGYKFDAGDPHFYRADDLSAVPTTPNGHCEAWARIGLRYSFNEYRACWKLAGQPLVQRLRDKNHSWGVDGLLSLIPNGLAQGLLGYAFVCPDMIGGGQYLDFIAPEMRVDQELMVRYAQCSALFPMMQFSAAPWRVLDGEHLAMCVTAAQLHHALGPEILALAQHAARSGEPIMRHLAYVFPDGGYEHINDQFMLGNAILVAPVLYKGATSRTIVFPPGNWHGDDGSIVHGPATRTVAAPLARLPWYRRERR